MERRLFRYRQADAENSREQHIEDTIISRCKILYSDAALDMSQSCMCFGWECGFGWHETLENLSMRLEALNLTIGREYGVKIKAEQVKEKYGALRFYYSTAVDLTPFKKCIVNFLRRTCRLLKADFSCKTIVDQKSQIEEQKREITKETYKEMVKKVAPAVRKEFIEDKKNKKFYQVVNVFVPQKSHVVATKHVLRYKLFNVLKRIVLRLSIPDDPTVQQEIVMSAMSQIADELIAKATDECYNVCEKCGTSIGVDAQHPRCQTKGWVKYICKKCADANKDCQYYIGKDLYQNGKKVVEKKHKKVKKEEKQS